MQELESQRRRNNADEPNALHASLKAYLLKHDPEQKAKRNKKHYARADNRFRFGEKMKHVCETATNAAE